MKRRMMLALAVALGIHVAACAGGYHTRTVATADLAFVYDPGLRVYVVETMPGIYYYSGVYYRVSSGSWQRSSTPNGNWKPCPKHKLPPGLRKKMG